MRENVENTLGLLDKITIKCYDNLYIASIAKEAMSGNDGNSDGILILGMVVVIVGLIGFIITNNKS